jgi:hypothetical protein
MMSFGDGWCCGFWKAKTWCQKEVIKTRLQKGKREKAQLEIVKFYFQIGEIALF